MKKGRKIYLPSADRKRKESTKALSYAIVEREEGKKGSLPGEGEDNGSSYH